tara:strand:+ start:115 stop:501 length:387 start_codon:yes stop_codon:yes gene_type:complete
MARKKRRGLPSPLGNVGRSPLHFNWKKAMDHGQTALTVAGLTPGVGIIPDALNTLVSGGRAAYEGIRGNKKEAKKHLTNVAVNAGTMIPGIGQGVASGKLAMKGLKAADKAGKVVTAAREINSQVNKS